MEEIPSSLAPFRDDFENSGEDNGKRWFSARRLMAILDLEDFKLLSKPVNKAIAACLALNFPVIDHFIQNKLIIEGKEQSDWKLSRFACYLVTINCDVRNRPRVAAMQAYFIGLAEAMRQYLEKVESIERVIARDELTQEDKALAHHAKLAGVEYYGLFLNAGYMGMYNMNLSQLKTWKGISKDQTLFDFMGSTELAANLFRVTQTSEKIKNEKIRGQRSLEDAARKVGEIVRATMFRISGTYPESFPLADNIKDVRKGLRGAQKQFAKIDKPKKLLPPKKKN
jgi:DNA-damage-inducible protein D